MCSWELIRELDEAGLSPGEIAFRLGLATPTVRYHLRARAEPDATSHVKPERPQAGRSSSRPVGTRELVRALLERGLSRSEIARRLGIGKSTVSYHARRLGSAMDDRCARRFDWARGQAYYDADHSVAECASAFGFSTWSWHQAVKRGDVTARPRSWPIEVVFAPNTRRNRGHLKARLLGGGLKSGECERCGIREWLGHPLTMDLHHINGDRYDNRMENLQLLCPNCHAQTDNFAGRNGREMQSCSVRP